MGSAMVRLLQENQGVGALLSSSRALCVRENAIEGCLAQCVCDLPN